MKSSLFNCISSFGYMCTAGIGQLMSSRKVHPQTMMSAEHSKRFHLLTSVRNSSIYDFPWQIHWL